MTKLFAHRLGAIDPNAVRALAARDGFLLATPTALRAGFGAPLAAASGDPASLFVNLQLSGDAAPTDALVAFADQPFEPSEPTNARVCSHTVTVRPSGAWLVSVDPEPSLVLEALGHVPPPDRAAGVTLGDVLYELSPDKYAAAVATVAATLGRDGFDKVVLARRASGRADADLDPAAVLERLSAREPACTAFAFPSGGGWRYSGASPELLVSRVAGVVSAHPLAGSASLTESESSLAAATRDLSSDKNRHEHRVVVEEIVAQLTWRCVDVQADPQPSVIAFNSVAHLGTNVHARSDPARPATAHELLTLLHPTPAVGGRPRDRALAAIRKLEAVPRGLYAGAVGWVDRHGDGEWWIAIRGVETRGAAFRAWGGAGIVADSDPDAERVETADKLDRLLYGLTSDTAGVRAR